MNRIANKPSRARAEDRILRAAIEVIVNDGVDGTTVGKVTEAALLTRPTFYAYFESVPGLLASIWLTHGSQWLHTVSDVSTSVEETDPEGVRVFRALTEIFAVSHRIPEVLEVVRPTVIEWWQTVTDHGSFHAEKVSWWVSQRIGAVLTTPVDPDAEQSNIVLSMLASLPLVPSIPDGSVPAVDASSLDMFEPRGAKDIDEQMVLAAIGVMASSGVRAASVARIARRAKVSTATLYSRFPTIDVLVAASFDYAIRAVVGDNVQRLQETGSPQDFGRSMLKGLTPSRVTWRNFRTELHLEARHRDVLAHQLSTSIRMANVLLMKNSVVLRQAPRAVAESLAYSVHCLAIGLSVLHNAGAPVGDLDHPRISVEMGSLLRSAPI